MIVVRIRVSHSAYERCVHSHLVDVYPVTALFDDPETTTTALFDFPFSITLANDPAVVKVTARTNPTEARQEVVSTLINAGTIITNLVYARVLKHVWNFEVFDFFK